MGKNKEPRYYSQTWGAADVRCPFWKGETTRAVVCEGLVAGENMRRLLPSEDAKKALMKKYCCREYESCKIFQLIYGNYT